MISKLTLGTVQLGLEYGINNSNPKPTLEDSFNILEYAYSNNITSLDTAPAYGNSEEIIGMWIKYYNHKDVYVTTKIPSLYKKNLKKTNLYSYIEEMLYTSLNNLNLSTVDNLLIHDSNDLSIYGEHLYECMIDFKRQGYINNIGCSIYEPLQLSYYEQYDLDTIQFPASLLNNSVLTCPNASIFKHKHIRTFVRSAFVQGLIFINPKKLPPKLTSLKPYLETILNLSKKYDLKVHELALNYLYNSDLVDSIVFGVDTLKQLNEILNTKVTILDLNQIDQALKGVPLELVDPRTWN